MDQLTTCDHGIPSSKSLLSNMHMQSCVSLLLLIITIVILVLVYTIHAIHTMLYDYKFMQVCNQLSELSVERKNKNNHKKVNVYIQIHLHNFTSVAPVLIIHAVIAMLSVVMH